MDFYTNIDLKQNELQNAVIHSTSAPGSPVEGQVYYNSTSKKAFIYNGTSWVELTNAPAGAGYTFLSDGSTTASAGTSDTIKFRSANNRLSLAVGDDDPTHGDNILFTLNEGNIHHGALSGLGDDDHSQYLLLAGRSGQTINDDLTLNGTLASGAITSSGVVEGTRFTSTVTTGTAPLTVASTTKVTNLNADLLDGYNTATTRPGNSSVVVVTDPATGRIDSSFLDASVFDHGSLSGLSDDDHSQYALLLGRAGGQTLIGGTAAGDDLYLNSTSSTTKGSVFINTAMEVTTNSITITGTVDVASTITASRLISDVTSGTAPLSVVSTTKVDNLHADRLDNAHASAAPGSGTIPIADGSGKLASGWISGVLGLGDIGSGYTTTGTGTVIVLQGSPTLTTPNIASFSNAIHNHQNTTGGGQLDHGLALTGLGDDDHTQYALLAGRSGGQVFVGGTGTGDSLTLRATSASSGGTLNFRANNLSSGTVDLTAATFNVDATTVTFNNTRLQGVADPTASTDAANKAYVDSLAVGLTDWKESVRLASTANVNISAPGSQIDGVFMTNGDRILLKNQTSSEDNGIYIFNGELSAMTRADDANTDSEVTVGMYVFVEAGTVNGTSAWVLSAVGAGSLGTKTLTFTQFSGAGQITAGNGLTQNGNTIDVGAGTGIAVGADTVGLTGQALAFHNLSTSGIVARTGSGTVAARTITGTTNRINISNGNGVSGNPTIDIASTYVGQTSITTVGTISTGTWTATDVAVAHGGTGASNPADARNNLSSTSHPLPQKYTTDIGNGSNTSFTITHGLNTQAVQVSLFDNGTNEQVMAQVENISTTQSTITFSGGVPTSNQFKVIVIG